MTCTNCQKLEAELKRIQDVIRKHRDYRGDDRCFQDDYELYNDALPEGVDEADLRLNEPLCMMQHCLKYIAHRHDPSLEYLSPQREIERLEQIIKKLMKND